MIYKDIWGNNADSMSMLYSGTGALKTDFTRTGKRTIKGAIKDGYNSIVRYYLNNLEDGKRQVYQILLIEMIDLIWLIWLI